MKNMKYYILGSVMLLVMSFTGAKIWYLLSSKEYGFKMEFPEKPSEKADVVNSAIGKLKMNMYMLEPAAKSQDENLVYLVNYTEYPESSVNSNNKDQLATVYKNSIDGAVKNVNGKLLSEKDVSIGKYSGKEVRIDYQDGVAIITMRMYLVNNKMYLLETICETKKDGNASISKFMESFALLAE